MRLTAPDNRSDCTLESNHCTNSSTSTRGGSLPSARRVATLHRRMVDEAERLRREYEWLRREVAAAANLDDADRVAILEDLWVTAEAIRDTKSADQLRREEIARQRIDGHGLARYRALAERSG